jgi:RNA polymerase sigma-70 factor (ECF subfamily)
VQASLVRALERLDQCSSETHLDRWLFRILKTVWINTRRSSILRRAESMEDHRDALVSDGVREMEAKIALSEVRAGFERLTPEQREVILLVCVEGYTYSATAELLGVPVGTVMSRLSRARAALMAMASVPDFDNVRSFPMRSVASDASSR